MHDQHVMRFLDGWVVMEDGQIDPTEVYFSKDEAARYAEKRARKYNSDLVIHGIDGTVKMKNN